MGEYSELSCAELLIQAIPVTELEIALYAALKKLVGKQKFDPIAMAIPVEVDFNNWERWCEYRKGKRKPVTERAAQEQTALLKLYSVAVQRQIITTSIMNDYTGIFPPRGTGNGQTGNSSSGNPKPDNSAVGRVRANATRERAKLASAGSGIDHSAVGINDRDVRPQVDESIRRRDRPEQCVGSILEGDYAGDGKTRA